jgi:hypothetical protein
MRLFSGRATIEGDDAPEGPGRVWIEPPRSDPERAEWMPKGLQEPVERWQIERAAQA